jgi:hypothetical protein
MNILVIGRHAEITETIIRLLESRDGWTAKGALTDEEALNLFKSEKINFVLIGGGVSDASEAELRGAFKMIDPAAVIIQHFGGGSGLLFNEIEEALRSKPNSIL